MDNVNAPYFVKLRNRGLIHIEGDDRKAFLQGLISNDMGKLKPGAILYACLLTPQGKFLHDFFIHEGDGFLLLDCEGGARAQDLYRRLSMYKLRSNVQLSVEEENEVYAIISAERPGNGALPDPRHNHMGYRSFMQPEKIEEAAFDVWDRHRIRLCVPDGSRDMQLEKSTLLESNIDKLNGLSFKKGCYMGQEITARMHFRGLAKKHLYAVESDGPLPHADETIIVNEKLAGAMRSSNGHIGIALLKDDMTDNLESIGMRLITPQSPPEET